MLHIHQVSMNQYEESLQEVLYGRSIENMFVLFG